MPITSREEPMSVENARMRCLQELLSTWPHPPLGLIGCNHIPGALLRSYPVHRFLATRNLIKDAASRR